MSGMSAEGEVDTGVYSNSEWLRLWQDDDTPWNSSTPDPVLEARNAEIFEGKTKSVFVPLCGKTPDMLWMYKQGHTVCGAELAEQAVKEFFDENSIPVEVEEVKSIGNVYKSTDGRVKIYAGDLYDLSKDLCGTFDVIWDSGSLQAINKADREKYSKLMLSLMKPSTIYCAWVVEYDQTVFAGPPHSVPLECMQQLYGAQCNIEQLIREKQPAIMDEYVEAAKKEPEKSSSQIILAMSKSSYMFNTFYKITLKP